MQLNRQSDLRLPERLFCACSEALAAFGERMHAEQPGAIDCVPQKRLSPGPKVLTFSDFSGSGPSVFSSVF